MLEKEVKFISNQDLIVELVQLDLSQQNLRLVDQLQTLEKRPFKSWLIYQIKGIRRFYFSTLGWIRGSK